MYSFLRFLVNTVKIPAERLFTPYSRPTLTKPRAIAQKEHLQNRAHCPCTAASIIGCSSKAKPVEAATQQGVMIPYKIHDLIFFLFNLSHLPYIVHCPVNHILTYHTVNLLCNNVWRVVLKYLAAHITGFTFLLFCLFLSCIIYKSMSRKNTKRD